MKNKIYWFGYVLLWAVIIAGCFGVIIAAAYEAFATVPYVVTATLFGCSTGVLFMGLAAIIENTENTAHCLQALTYLQRKWTEARNIYIADLKLPDRLRRAYIQQQYAYRFCPIRHEAR